MPHSDQRHGWRAHLGWLAGELIVIFVGVSAAFFVENYRENRNQAAEFHQALSGVIAELNRTETPGREFADAITAKINEWKEADRSGKRAIRDITAFPARPIRRQPLGRRCSHQA